jgi:serine/threonine protein kinase
MFDYVGLKIGNYRLVRMVGHGGFADVYRGEHVYLRTEAAIKVLHPHLPGNLLQSFLIEARNHARLNHPNIVQVLDFGIEDNIPFLVMNYAPHGTLRQRYPPGSMLDPSTIVSYVKQVAAALHYAHTRNIIHRDIKPENMLLSNEDAIMLSDFGIAIALRNFHNADKLTLLSLGTTVAGTTTYMAPEQFSGTSYYASDQYSLATVVYEWFCGTPPFIGSDFQTAVKHMYRQPPSIRETIPTLALTIDRVVMKALEKNPQQRFASVQHFADALEAACQPISSRIYLDTKAFVPSIHSANTIQWSPRTGFMQERTSQFIANHLLLFSKTLSASMNPEQRTLMSFRQLSAPIPLQSQSLVLKHSAAPLSISASVKQTRTNQLSASHKKMLLLAIAIFCMIAVIALSLIPFMQANLQTPAKQIQAIVTRMPTKTDTNVAPVSLQTPKPSDHSKSTPVPTPTHTVLPTPHPTPTIKPTPVPPTPSPVLIVTPSALSTTSCRPDNLAYRCTVTLTLSSNYNGRLSWHASSTHVHAFFKARQGTLSPGQSQQIIIYVLHTCPASGSFVFSGSSVSVSVPLNC